MIVNKQQAFRALILLSFTLFILYLHASGEILKYINPKYIKLSQIASVVFLFLFFIQLTRVQGKKTLDHPHTDSCQHHNCHHSHDHGDQPLTFGKVLSYSLIVLPLLTGFLLPAQTLDASIVEKKGGMDVLVKKSQEEKSDSAPVQENPTPSESEVLPNPNEELSQDEMNSLIQKVRSLTTIQMSEEVYYPYYEEISKDVGAFVGKEIKFKGFVYKEEGFATNQLVLSRFLITHCVADASIIGFLSEFEESANMEVDSWIEATGTIETTTYNNTTIPLIKIKSWKSINPPDEPYIYPVNVRIL